MNSQAHKLRYPLHLMLAASLLLLGWFQLHHELTAHHENDGEACEICVFAGHLSDGAVASSSLPVNTDQPIRTATARHYEAPFLALLFRSALSQRGPPLHALT